MPTTGSYNNLEAEPAFLANQRAKMGRRGDQAAQTSGSQTLKPKSSLQKSLADCCYSSSNLIIILACTVGLFFAIKFVNDEPLYEYGEHLLSLRFYRQIIYIIVILPLILLVPIFNAASVCCHSLGGSTTFKQSNQLGRSSLITKLAYQILVALLAFIGLIFVAPSIRYSGLVKQIDWEFKRHMELRYDKDFSFDFVERIQTVFECCDELWYRSRYNDKLPISCFAPLPIPYSSIYQQTCPEAIGSLVSNRCMIIAACLMAILAALAILIALDVLELIAPRRTYDVRAREQQPPVAGTSGGGGAGSPSSAAAAAAARSDSPLIVGPDASIGRRYDDDDDDDDDNDDDDGGFIRRRMMASVAEQAAAAAASHGQQQNRLGSSERRRERPLLPDERKSSTLDMDSSRAGDDDDDDDDLRRSGPAASSTELPTILTKASYFSQAHARPRSPLLLVRSSSPAASAATNNNKSSSGGASAGDRTPPRGVLKKTGSLSRSIDRESLFDRDEQTTTTTIEREINLLQQQQTFQQQPTLQGQRSPFSVRFADS